MGFSAFPTGLQLVATTGLTGFTLQNATPTVLTWTPPNDGQMHRLQVVSLLSITSLQTGGLIRFWTQTPDNGQFRAKQMYAGGGAAGYSDFGQILPCYPGVQTKISQDSALTAGAAILWAEMWAS